MAIPHLRLNELSPGISSAVITGIIIAKSEARSFPSKKFVGTNSNVLGFTLRDSVDDTINVTCWGSEDYTKQLEENYHVGSVVEISNVTVQPLEGREESFKFKPRCSSLYELSASEHHTTITGYLGNLRPYIPLLAVPTKDIEEVVGLDYIVQKGTAVEKTTLNLFVVVTQIGSITDVNTKTGRQLKRRELRIADESGSSIYLVLWDSESIGMSNEWNPLQTVLFLSDILVSFNDFKRSVVATVGSQTIITVDPDIPETRSLKQFAFQNESALAVFDVGSSDVSVDFSAVENVMTVDQLREQMELMETSPWMGPFPVIVFAYLSSFDLDGSSRVTTHRCSYCRSRLQHSYSSCSNSSCPAGAGVQSAKSITQFDLIVSLSDQSGSVSGCYLSGNAAESVMGLTADQFELLTLNERTELKWKHLLERCRFQILLTVSGSVQGPKVNVLLKDLCIASPGEVVSQLSAF